MITKDKIKEIYLCRNPAIKYFTDIIYIMSEKHSVDDLNLIIYCVDSCIIFIRNCETNIISVSYSNMLFYLEEEYGMNFIESREFLLVNCKKYLNWDIGDIKNLRTF